MARVKLTEYRAKKLLLGDAYQGMQLRTGETPDAPHGEYVLKVDEGVKKRMKRGLVALKIAPREAARKTEEWAREGYSNFILEPFFPHEAGEERYLSFERVRDGIRVMHAAEGGIEVEEHPEKVAARIVGSADDAAKLARELSLPEAFMRRAVEAFDEHHLSFLEINPLIVRGGEAYLLDAAAMADGAAAFFVHSWSERDVPKGKSRHPAEARVEALAATTPASLRLTVINPEGSLFFLLSGGGGSIVIADEAAARGMGKEIANYGEYSGGPTEEETYLYAKEIVDLMLASGAPKKALVIAGGVANFTDVAETFRGIVRALDERTEELANGKVRVFVRRGGPSGPEGLKRMKDFLAKRGVKVFVRQGGPSEAAGLALMRDFLEARGILGSVAGSEVPLTAAIEEAVAYLKS